MGYLPLGSARDCALRVLVNLSAAAENLVYMGSKGLGLVPILQAVVSSNCGTAREYALAALQNLSTASRKVLLVSPTR